MEQSGLGTTVLVDEIISEALQKLRSGNMLPDEPSSMSLLSSQEPVGHSTAVGQGMAKWERRSFTDDVLQSFIDRRSTTFGQHSSQRSSNGGDGSVVDMSGAGVPTRTSPPPPPPASESSTFSSSMLSLSEPPSFAAISRFTHGGNNNNNDDHSNRNNNNNNNGNYGHRNNQPNANVGSGLGSGDSVSRWDGKSNNNNDNNSYSRDLFNGMSCSNLFDEPFRQGDGEPELPQQHQRREQQQKCQQQRSLDHSDAFVSGEMLLDEFEADAKRCEEDNLFMTNGSVPFVCSSLVMSPEKVARKQVSTPDWAEMTPQLDSLSMFHSNSEVLKLSLESSSTSLGTRSSNGNNRDSAHSSTDDAFRTKILPKRFSPAGSAQGDDTLTHTDKLPAYCPGLPYHLGVILPGVVTSFELPAPPGTEVKLRCVRTVFGGTAVDFCRALLSGQNVLLKLAPPPATRGTIQVELDFLLPQKTTVRLVVLSLVPLLTFPAKVVLPPGTSAQLIVKSSLQFAKPLRFQVRSQGIVRTKEVTLPPDSDHLQLEVVAGEHEDDRDLDIEAELLAEHGNVVASLKGQCEVRHPRIVLRCVAENAMTATTSVAVRNDESFDVQLRLNDDLGGLAYTNELCVPARQTAHVSVQFRAGDDNNGDSGVHSRSEPVVTFRAEMLAPVRAVLPESKCCVTLTQTPRELRPDLARFLWLADDELVFAMLDSKPEGRNKPVPWKDHVRISPCHIIKDYVRVLEEPADLTKVLLRVKRPPKLIVGRLRFYRRTTPNESSNVTDNHPYGFRYPILPPERPILRWYTSSDNTAARVYKMPLDGKLRVANLGQCHVFLIIGRRPGGCLLEPGGSVEIILKDACRIFYGLEEWRRVVRQRIAPQHAKIQAQFLRQQPDSGLDPDRILARIEGESNEPRVDESVLNKIPDDPQSLLRLYALFTTTMEEVQVEGSTREASTFFVPAVE